MSSIQSVCMDTWIHKHMHIYHKHIYTVLITYTHKEMRGHEFLNFIPYFVCMCASPCMSKYACRSQKTTSQNQFSPFAIWGIELRSSDLTAGPESSSQPKEFLHYIYLFIYICWGCRVPQGKCEDQRMTFRNQVSSMTQWQQVPLRTEPSHQPLLFGGKENIFYFKNYYFYVVCAWFACMHIYAPHHAWCSHRLEEAAELLGTGVIVVVIATVWVLRSKAMPSARAISAV